jgi:hypothetical protein
MHLKVQGTLNPNNRFLPNSCLILSGFGVIFLENLNYQSTSGCFTNVYYQDASGGA